MTTVYRGATVIRGDGTRLHSADITVTGDTIVGVDPHDPRRRPAEGAVVDLAGRFVMPCIVNPHGHIGYLANGTTSAVNFSRANVIDHLRRLAYYGVGAFQSLGTDRDDTELEVRDAQAAGTLSDTDCALLLSASTGLVARTPGGPNGGAYFATDVMVEVADPEDARLAAKRVCAKRPNAIKIWIDDRGGTKRKIDQATAAAIVECAHGHGIPVYAHVFTLDDAKCALRAGIDVLAHMVRAPEVDDELLDLLKSTGATVFSSISVHQSFADDSAWLDEPWVRESITVRDADNVRSGLGEYHEHEVADIVGVLPLMTDEIGLLQRQGIPVSLSADTGLDTQLPGIAEHRELAAMVDAGMSPADAIRAATSVPAKLLRLHHRGLIAAGMRADLVVLQSDPYENIRNTRGIVDVYLGGRRLDRGALSKTWINQEEQVR